MRIRTVSTDLSLLILAPNAGAVVRVRWLGGGQTMELAREVLARPPGRSAMGLECWADLTPTEVARIASGSYAGGATVHEVTVLATEFPAPPYVWTLIRDY